MRDLYDDVLEMRTFGSFGRSRIAAVGGTLLVVALLAGAIGTLATGKLHYRNYWGGQVFAPFVLVIVAILIVYGVRSRFGHRKPPAKLRGRAARKSRQAENTKFPIDDYRKW